VSGQHLVYFDPHCLHLPRVSSTDPGKRIDFTEASVAEQYPDQFQPYCVWGNDMRRRFDGTVFRFPLRTAQQVGATCAQPDGSVRSPRWLNTKQRVGLKRTASHGAVCRLSTKAAGGLVL
jgi:hypothetical protein